MAWSKKVPVLRFWHSAKTRTFLPGYPTITAVKDGGWFTANVDNCCIVRVNSDTVGVRNRI
jgi:hypothetical protein